MLVSISLAADAAPGRTVPASLLNGNDSLTSAVPSARQKTRASSVSTRLHWGHRFISYSQGVPHSLAQGLFINELGGDKVTGFCFVYLIDGENVRMIKRRSSLGSCTKRRILSSFAARLTGRIFSATFRSSLVSCEGTVKSLRQYFY